MGRTVMNQGALYSFDLGECFTYSERIRTTHRNFSTGFEGQSLRQEFAQGGKFGRASETWISKNSLESHFSFIKNVSLVVRSWIKMRYISLFQENVLHNQNVCVQRIENFLQASEVKVFTKIPLTMIESSKAWQRFRDLNFKKSTRKSLFLQ